MGRGSMEDNVSLKEYNNTIREMINHENEIRNQRTNWFLVIQGFLIAGLCQLQCNDTNIKIMISFIGIATSISFSHAAWRSERAVTFAIKCWEFQNKGKKKYPPVSLITEEILKAKDVESWEYKIRELMYKDKCCCILWFDKLRNRCDRLLPYSALPILFFLFWALYIYLIWHDQIFLKDMISEILCNIHSYLLSCKSYICVW